MAEEVGARDESDRPELAAGGGCCCDGHGRVSARSVSQRQTVLARVRAAGEGAALAVDPDRLTAAVRLVDRTDLVAEAGQRLAGLEADAALDLDLAFEREQPGQEIGRASCRERVCQ